MQKKFKILILFLFSQLIECKQYKTYYYSSQIQPWTIIWDLGDTLLRADKLAMAKEIGFGKFLSYIFKEGKNPHKIKTLVFEILNSLKSHPDTKWLAEHNGEVLPAIMTDWFNGSESSEAIIEKALAKTQSFNFSSQREKELVESIIKTMFDPKVLAQNQKPIKKMVKILDRCSCIVDQNCNPLHRLMVFSNWDPKSFDFMLESPSCEQVFSYFEPKDIIISGKLGLSKPDPESFKRIIKEYNLDPSRCVFIDDIDKNLEAAASCGMCTVKADSAKKVAKRLKCLGVLPD